MTEVAYTAASIHLWLDRLWDDDRARFWAVVGKIGDPAANPHARATFAQVVVELASAAGDLLPLSSPVMRARDVEAQDLDTLTYVVDHARATVGDLEVEPWLELCETLARCPVARAVASGALLLAALLVRPELLPHRARAGTCARAILAQAWELEDPQAAEVAFSMVIATIDTDVAASVRQLARVIAEDRLAARHRLLRTMAWRTNEVLTLGGTEGAEMVARLYAAVGASAGEAARESDAASSDWLLRATDEGVDLAGPLPARRRSELADVAESLGRAERVQAFLRASPERAVATLASILLEFELPRPRDRSLVINGKVTRVQGRANWPSTRLGFEGGITSTLCDELAEQATKAPSLARALVGAIAAPESPIDLWQAVIGRAASSLPLLEQVGDLFGCEDAVRLMSQGMACAIRQHGTAFPAKFRATLDLMVGRLGNEGLDAHARKLIGAALRGEDRENSFDDDELRVAGATTPAVDADDAISDGMREQLRWLDMSEADIESPQNRAVILATARARRSAGAIGPDLQGKVPLAEPGEIEVAKQRLVTLLGALEQLDIHQAAASVGWGAVGRLASGIVRQGGSDDIFVDALLRALERRPLREGPTSDLLNRHADEGCVTCIDGLVALAARGDSRAFDAVKRAVTDEEPAKRFQVADRVHELAHLPDDGGWKLVEQLVRDVHPEVASATTTSFQPFYQLDLRRALALDNEVLHSTRGKLAYRGQVNALSHLAWYHLRRGDAVAGQYLMAWLQAPDLEGPIGQILHIYRAWLVLGGERDDDLTADEQAVMARAWAMFKVVSDRALRDLASTPTTASDAVDAPSPSARLIDDLGHQLYFASGVFDNSPALTTAGRSRFWERARPLLCDVGTGSVLSAAALVLEVLDHFLAKPAGLPVPEVLSLFLHVAASAVKYGYARAWRAIDIVDRVLRRAAHEYPGALQSVDARVMATSVVDAFLDAKVQEAYLLARDLDLSNLGPRLRR